LDRDVRVFPKREVEAQMATLDSPPFEARINVNRRPFTIRDRRLTGHQIAAMIGVPADNAVVEREIAGDLMTLALAEKVEIEDGASFLVTRQFIMGGCAERRIP
jgi:Multiubiquitin